MRGATRINDLALRLWRNDDSPTTSATYAFPVMRLTLGSHAPRFQVHIPATVPAAHCPSVSGTVRVPMLKLDFLGDYDFADMLMLAASVVVVVSILIAI
jgi:hypothetical protein